jgi:AcrR family transcriptional regulator
LAAAENRRPRADATRNREQLLVVATRMFASAKAEPSMRAIANEAGVGIATLYRHFPTREALVDAVYQDQVKVVQLLRGDSVADLAAQLAPRLDEARAVVEPAGGLDDPHEIEQLMSEVDGMSAEEVDALLERLSTGTAGNR